MDQNTNQLTNPAEIESRVLDLIAEQLQRPLADVTLDSQLESDLGADSLDAVEAVGPGEDVPFDWPWRWRSGLAFRSRTARNTR